ncbi:MAG TPA: ATP-grasp domain-containing protein [Gaiellaceae bacterium]|nr:ATP-grasp domain-containing protein [Gaiellaceae bacterium]
MTAGAGRTSARPGRGASLLVLGASRYQLEVITRAKELGYRVLTTDNVPDNPGHRLADESYAIDTTDVESVVRLAKEKQPRGVVAPCTDVAVTTAAHVAEALGLPGIPPASARSLTSKVLFRQFLVERGLPAPRFRILGADDVGADVELPCAGPMIVKPDGSSGSKGIFIVRDRKELLERLPVTLSFSPAKRGVVEELIEGSQGTCEGVIVDGEIVLALLTDRRTAPAPFVVTAGHFVPSRLGEAARARTIALIARVLESYGVRTSPFDCDFVVDERGEPWLLELTPRLGGNSLTRLVREATGIDLAEVAIRLACGEEVSLPRPVPETPTAQLILGVARPGLLSFDEGEAAALRSAPWVRDLSMDYPAGQPVEAFVNGRTRVGEATLVAGSREELDERTRELERRLALDARPAPAR